MRFKLFADLAEAAGDREVAVGVEPGATVGDALEALFEARPGLSDRVLDEDGEVRDSVNLLRNGRNVTTVESGLDTELEEGDELALFPPVSGG
ncbi:MAG: ubiquitin-like small modifier protein 1 [Haloferacaceae archaeon]